MRQIKGAIPIDPGPDQRAGPGGDVQHSDAVLVHSLGEVVDARGGPALEASHQSRHQFPTHHKVMSTVLAVAKEGERVSMALCDFGSGAGAPSHVQSQVHFEVADGLTTGTMG
jgi:hypothetical protein